MVDVGLVVFVDLETLAVIKLNADVFEAKLLANPLSAYGVEQCPGVDNFSGL